MKGRGTEREKGWEMRKFCIVPLLKGLALSYLPIPFVSELSLLQTQ